MSIRVTVFGGSLPSLSDEAYMDAFTLGKLLGESQCKVLTGGYIGTMEAVSQGAAQAGGYVIGVTCDEIEAWRPIKPNSWIHEELRFPTLRERMFALMEQCDAAFALPGGIGTLAEITVMWAQLQIGAIEFRPLILIGKEWNHVIDCFYTTLGDYISVDNRKYISFVSDVHEAYQKLNSFFPSR